jgi:hypothetical protein
VKPDAIVLSVGGGGLLCGVITGLQRHGWYSVQVVTVETDGAASFARALEAGAPVRLDGITSIATSLGALQASETAVRLAQVRAGLGHSAKPTPYNPRCNTRDPTNPKPEAQTETACPGNRVEAASHRGLHYERR